MDEQRKYVTIGMILTDQEIATAAAIFQNDQNNFHKRVLEELVKPNMERINKSLGGENDPSYLAYMIEYAFLRSRHHKSDTP